MTNKEIANRLRKILAEDYLDAKISELADELDPPRPEPGTVVWWQDAEGLGDPALGQFNDLGRIELFGTTQMIHPDSVKYWLARICAPDEAPVKIPPVSEWPIGTDRIEGIYVWRDGTLGTSTSVFEITREQAERMEAENE